VTTHEPTQSWVREIDRALRQAHIRPDTAASPLAEDEQEARALT